MKVSIRRAAALAAASIVLCVASSSSFAQQRKWGAVAYTSGAVNYYSRWNHNSESEAYAEAMRRCGERNAGRCEIQTFSGDNCLGLVSGMRGGNRYAYWTRNAGFQRTRQAAQNACTTQGYQPCNIRTIVCANGMH